MKYRALLAAMLCYIAQTLHAQVPGINLPKAAVVTDSMGNVLSMTQNIVQVKALNDTVYYITADIVPGKNMKAANIDLPVSGSVDALKKAFHWLPNIKSAPGQVVSQHVFRSPCIIVSLEKGAIVLVPDVEALAGNTAAPYYLDLQYTGTRISLHYGLSNYAVARHQYYKRSGKPFVLPSKLHIAFYLLKPTTNEPLSVLQTTNNFLWNKLALKYTNTVLPQTVPFGKYAETGYGMAFQHYWVDAGNGRGGITLSTFYDDSTKIYRGRDAKDDLWYQSWFNNMRTAYGLYSWGGQLQNNEWQNKAMAAVKLLLDAPRNKGWFPTVYNTNDNSWVSSGQGGGPTVYHVPDNTWTAYWLLRFTDEMHPVAGADDMLLGLANGLLKVQNADGSFPTRVDIKTLHADTVLNNTASSAIATWYLEELLLHGKIPATLQPAYREAIQRSLSFLQQHVLPQQRFEDFESYFSCSPKPMHYFDTATNMYAQNTLSLQWCAQALLKAHQLFNKLAYLHDGEYCLNILSLYQQVWNPPFISFYAFGGFGAQNTDAEWSDARQAQFADTYLQYFQATHNKEYLERAVYACRASFALMVLPENKTVCPKNYMGTDFNGEAWPGTMAENYGHDGVNKRSYQSGFHWGTGSALTTAAIFKQALGDVYIDVANNIAIGVDGIVVKHVEWGTQPQLTTQRLNSKTNVIIHANGGANKTVLLDKQPTTVE